MPNTTKKVNLQTTEVLLIVSHNQHVPTGAAPRHRETTMPVYIADACRLMARRGRYGVHLSEIGGSVNAGRGALAEFELLNIPFKITSIPRRGTNFREEWVIGQFDLCDAPATAASEAA